ncbi:hypothetical protein ACROYT_G014663 [Oculina patagonica]
MFRVNLAKSLITASEMQVNPSPGPGRPQKSNVRAEHCPIPISNERLDQKATKASLGRKNCKLCYDLDKKQQKTPWQCSKCNIPLCLQLDRNCFQKWHSAEFGWVLEAVKLFYDGLLTSAIEEKIIQSTDLMSQSYQICLEIYQTPKVDIIIKLDDFKKQLPTADLDVVEEEFKKSLSLFTEIKKMISEERKRRHVQQLKNKKRLTNVKTNVKLTRRCKRLQDADSIIITNGLSESQE